MKEEPLFAFGYGLSYTTFDYGKMKLSKDTYKQGELLNVTVPVTNVGTYTGDEVIQLYLRKENDPEGPIKTLRSFKRINIPASETAEVIFNLGDKELEWWDESSNTVRVCPGKYDILVGSSSQEKDLQVAQITIQ